MRSGFDRRTNQTRAAIIAVSCFIVITLFAGMYLGELKANVKFITDCVEHKNTTIVSTIPYLSTAAVEVDCSIR